MTRLASSGRVAPIDPPPHLEVNAMEPALMPEIELDPRTDEELRIHDWRAEQLHALGVPRMIADWSQTTSTGMRSLRSWSAAAGRAGDRDRPLMSYGIPRSGSSGAFRSQHTGEKPNARSRRIGPDPRRHAARGRRRPPLRRPSTVPDCEAAVTRRLVARRDLLLEFRVALRHGPSEARAAFGVSIATRM